MDLPFLKMLGAAVAPVKWLYRLCVDQTRIEIATPHVANWPRQSLPVQDDGSGCGQLLFSVTTRSKLPVEITRIEVTYAAPLQLLDPGTPGFFVGSDTLDRELPFCMSWEGRAVVRSDLQQAFALTARFPDRVHEQLIRISVHARRQHSTIGGFVAEGRPRVTTIEYRARPTSEPILGLLVPPKGMLTTLQPFLIEGAMTASGGPGPVVVHERLSDGTVSSKRVDLP